jgi:hypothetical protein
MRCRLSIVSKVSCVPSLVLCLATIALTGCDSHPASTTTGSNSGSLPPRYSSTQPLLPGPVAAIWFDQTSTLAPAEPNRLIVGVWSDGTVVWSNDQRHGGKPYLTGKIDTARVQQLANDLAAAGLFDPQRQVWFGPDATLTVIAVRAGGTHQWLGSWHDPSPTDPNFVYTEKGLTVVEPNQPRPVPSLEYQHFRKIWADARSIIEATVPANSFPAGALDQTVFQLGR